MRIIQRSVISLVLILCTVSIYATEFAATIPVIDMNDFYSSERHAKFITDLANAMRTVGFVAVINSRVDKNVLNNAYDNATRFYAQSSATKMRFCKPELNGQRGYVQSETAQGNAKKDHKEFYHIARDYPNSVKKKYRYIDNVWPDDPKFKAAMQNLIHELSIYEKLIGMALAESIGEKPDFFANMTQNGDFLLRSIHYPANPPSDSIWAAAHTDIDLFTILPRATAEGLQVLNAEGEWIDVKVPDNAFIINAGDMLQNITNGVYKSAKHRVICSKPGIERYSIVAFIHPRPNDQVDPLPKFIQEIGSQKYANATRDELLFERLIELGLHSPKLLAIFAESKTAERLIAVNRASPKVLDTLRQANLASNEVLDYLRKTNENQS